MELDLSFRFKDAFLLSRPDIEDPVVVKYMIGDKADRLETKKGYCPKVFPTIV